MSQKTVCAGCGQHDGAHAETCTDLSGVRARLEKRIAELEAELAGERERTSRVRSYIDAAIRYSGGPAPQRLLDAIAIIDRDGGHAHAARTDQRRQPK